jgi:hypothetical protein
MARDEDNGIAVQGWLGNKHTVNASVHFQVFV